MGVGTEKGRWGKITRSLRKRLRKLAEIIGLNPYVREYLMAEFQFTQIMMEIQHILNEAMGIHPLEDRLSNGGPFA
jgi:Protein of unknown function (DUF964).